MVHETSMKGEVTLRLLEIIAEVAGGIEDTFAAFLTAGYGASIGKLKYEARQHARRRMRKKARFEEKAKIRQRYYVMLSHLKTEGLIAEKERKDKFSFLLTRKGEKKMEKLQARRKVLRPRPFYHVPKEERRMVIVAFDISEKERWKRAWLRAALKNLGLRKAQQSVWIGKITLPKEFLDDLLRLRLVEFVEIFEVTKLGSLSHVL